MSTSASSLAQIFSRFPGMPSGPVALFSFTLRRSLRTPALDMEIFGMGWSGFMSTCAVPEGEEKTWLKNVLNMLALERGFCMRIEGLTLFQV